MGNDKRSITWVRCSLSSRRRNNPPPNQTVKIQKGADDQRNAVVRPAHCAKLRPAMADRADVQGAEKHARAGPLSVPSVSESGTLRGRLPDYLSLFGVVSAADVGAAQADGGRAETAAPRSEPTASAERCDNTPRPTTCDTSPKPAARKPASDDYAANSNKPFPWNTAQTPKITSLLASKRNFKKRKRG